MVLPITRIDLDVEVPLKQKGSYPLDKAKLQNILDSALNESLRSQGTNKVWISGQPKGAGFVVSDILSLIRSSIDQGNLLHVQNHVPKELHGVMDGFSGKGMSVVYQLSGFSSAINVVGWASNLPSVVRGITHAKAIGDKRGLLMQRVSLAKDLAGIGGGVALGGAFRALSIASIFKGVSISGFRAPSLLGRLSYSFLFVGLCLFSIFNTLMSINCAISLYEGEKLRRQLRACKSVEEQTFLLKKKLEVNPELLREKLKKQYGESYNKELTQQALSAAVKGLQLILKESGEKVQPKQLEKLLKHILAEEAQSEGEDPQSSLGNFLEKLGFELKMRALQEKKENKLGRLLGPELLAQLKANDITPATVSAVKSAINHNLRIQLIILGVLTLSTVALIAAIVLTGGVGAIVAAALMLLSSITMLALDYYFFKKSIESENPGLHDQKMILLSIMASLASIVAVSVLSALGILSFGTAPLAVFLVISLVWLGYNFYTLKKVRQKEEEQKAALQEIQPKKKELDLEELRHALHSSRLQ